MNSVKHNNRRSGWTSFLVSEKKGIEENEEDMETSVYRDSCPDHDFNCITDHIGSGSGNTVLDGILRESRIY